MPYLERLMSTSTSTSIPPALSFASYEDTFANIIVAGRVIVSQHKILVTPAAFMLGKRVTRNIMMQLQ